MAPLEEIGHLADLPVRLGVELDRKVMCVQDILTLEPGSVIKLGRSAGQNIDVFVQGRLIAYGEIVVIEDSMGIRVTDFKSEE